MRTLLTGNEAIARGAYEYGVKVATAYPGTPSTEILENIAKCSEIHSQWSPNEKVALEVGLGAAIAGARVLVAMKHVGVNVAADPLFTAAYTGVRGGLVLVSTDDPGMHSSQNEQDNRHYAPFAKIPMLEPADSQQAKDMVGLALEISETFDTPVLLRLTTRVSHSRSLVNLGEPGERAVKPYQKDVAKYVMLPAYGRQRRLFIAERDKRLQAFAENTPVNRIEPGDQAFGIITSGISYLYAREAWPEATILHLGMTHPLPSQMIREFAGQVGRLFVVEELEPYLENQIKAMGLPVTGKQIFPAYGELSVTLVKERIAGALGRETAGREAEPRPFEAPGRPPVMCPGCPHRGLFYVLRQLKLTVTGDIGCYTLGALPPLAVLDTCICMGASISGALGMEKGNPGLARRLVAVIGDSTFLHSGITGLMDIVYNGGTATVIILDNGTTAMTGHQDHPGTGRTLTGQPAYKVDFVALAKSLGVKRVTEVDPFDLPRVKEVVSREIAVPEPSVIIARRPCALLVKTPESPVVVAGCNACKACLRLGCPALSFPEGAGSVEVNPALCTGCGVCTKVCKFGALRKAGEENA
ncbi:MAG: indolepyruvate ferredoxin oxidoreductase subunit alpha [Heliobacteriaceae bacterium]|nr:indolepyruvate ferredoxin oxidoreductase subunit alpha [Heliobacteriaceae bacterium]